MLASLVRSAAITHSWESLFYDVPKSGCSEPWCFKNKQKGLPEIDQNWCDEKTDLKNACEINKYKHRRFSQEGTHLLKIVLRELVRDSKQIPASVRVGKSAYTQTIRWVELPFQKFATGILKRKEVALLRISLRRRGKQPFDTSHRE